MSQARKAKEIQQKQESRKKTAKAVKAALIAIGLCAGFFGALYFITEPTTIKTELQNGELVIPAGKIGSDMAYVDFGGPHLLLVRMGGDGEIKTAFNTCEDCYSRGATYKQQKETIVCSACGTTQALSSLGEESWGGCKPPTIPASYRADTEGNIVIPAPVLDFADTMFRSWASGDHSVTLENYSA